MATITDHALLRFIERVKGIDIEACRAEMQSPALDAAVKAGASYVRRGDGTRLVIRGSSVVTVLPAMSLHKFTGQEQSR